METGSSMEPLKAALITSTKFTLSVASLMEQLFRVSMPCSPINDKKRTALSGQT